MGIRAAPVVAAEEPSPHNLPESPSLDLENGSFGLALPLRPARYLAAVGEKIAFREKLSLR